MNQNKWTVCCSIVRQISSRSLFSPGMWMCMCYSYVIPSTYISDVQYSVAIFHGKVCWWALFSVVVSCPNFSVRWLFRVDLYEYSFAFICRAPNSHVCMLQVTGTSIRPHTQRSANIAGVCVHVVTTLSQFNGLCQHIITHTNTFRDDDDDDGKCWHPNWICLMVYPRALCEWVFLSHQDTAAAFSA